MNRINQIMHAIHRKLKPKKQIDITALDSKEFEGLWTLDFNQKGIVLKGVPNTYNTPITKSICASDILFYDYENSLLNRAVFALVWYFGSWKGELPFNKETDTYFDGYFEGYLDGGHDTLIRVLENEKYILEKQLKNVNAELENK